MKSEKSYTSTLLRTGKTVFSFKEISLLWQDRNKDAAKSRISYYVKKGELYHIRRGFYGTDENYERLELAGKIYTPAYISLETVLARAGIIFQYYESIFVVSYLTREIRSDGQTYSFKKIKDSVLTNSLGIIEEKNYFIATPERAFLDTVYLHKNYHFDNLSPLDWKKVFETLPIYGGNKRMEKSVQEFFSDNKSRQ